MNKKSFSIFDVKKVLFNLFIWFLNKIFKNRFYFIEGFNIKHKYLKSSEEIYFVIVKIISSKNISFINKNLIFYRLNPVLNKYYKILIIFILHLKGYI